MHHLHRHLLHRQSDHRIWAFGGKQLKNVRLHLASYAQIKIGWKKGHLAHCWYAKRPTALGIPRRSPIQVLTQPNAA